MYRRKIKKREEREIKRVKRKKLHLFARPVNFLVHMRFNLTNVSL